MQRILLFSTLWLLCSTLMGQSYLGFSAGFSKSDRHTESLWFQQQFTDQFSAGLRLSYGSLQYRFIDAKAITEGHVIHVGIPLGFKLAEGDRFRIDVQLNPSYRRISPISESSLAASSAIELDPNLIIGFPIREGFFLHTGLMLRTVFQIDPSPTMNEQFPSAILLNSFSYLAKSTLFSLWTYYGPMSGAGGDTEKFFWQISLGVQRMLGGQQNSSIPFFTF